MGQSPSEQKFREACRANLAGCWIPHGLLAGRNPPSAHSPSARARVCKPTALAHRSVSLQASRCLSLRRILGISWAKRQVRARTRITTLPLARRPAPCTSNTWAQSLAKPHDSVSCALQQPCPCPPCRRPRLLARIPSGYKERTMKAAATPGPGSYVI